MLRNRRQSQRIKLTFSAPQLWCRSCICLLKQTGHRKVGISVPDLSEANVNYKSSGTDLYYMTTTSYLPTTLHRLHIKSTTGSKSSKGKSTKQKKKSGGKGNGDRLIELGPKKSKSAYIRRRVKLVAGKSVADALTIQVPDKDGAMGPYKKSDFKYDVKSGFLVF